MSSVAEIFQIPTILYFPALLLSIAIAILSFFVEPFQMGYFAGGILAATLFAILIFMGVLLPAIYVTFEFTPESASSPLQLEAEVKRVTSTMQEGKSMKIVYAKSNPRIVKLPGE